MAQGTSDRRRHIHRLEFQWARRPPGGLGVGGLAPAQLPHHRPYPHLSACHRQATDGFPKDFVLLTSENGNGRTCDPKDSRFAHLDNWHSWSSYAGYAQPSPGWLEFRGQAVRADCVRILGVQLTQDGFGSRYLQLAEFEVYAGTQKIKPSGVAVSSALSTWPKERLIDGDTAPSGVPTATATIWPTPSGQPYSCPTPPPSTASASIPAPRAERLTAFPRIWCCSPPRTATAEPAIPKTPALLIWTTGILGPAMPAMLNLHPAGSNFAVRPCTPTVYASWASNSLRWLWLSLSPIS